MSFRSKTLSLQRAYFNDGFNDTLEAILRNSFAKLPRAADRIIPIDFFSKQLFASFEEAKNGSGVFVRVLEFEQAIGVINLDTRDSNAAVEEFFHPRKQKFLKEEMVFFIVRSHIVACNMKNKSRSLSENMLQLAKQADILSGDVKMRIADVPDKTTLERINDIGVRQIDFSINSFMANLNISTQHKGRERIMDMIFGMPSESDHIRKRANAMGKMILKRGRFSKEEVNKDQWLTNIGKELAMEDFSENFKLILEDGSKVSNSMLKKSRSVKIPRHANSFSFEHAKMELEKYYSELLADRSLGD